MVYVFFHRSYFRFSAIFRSSVDRFTSKRAPSPPQNACNLLRTNLRPLGAHTVSLLHGVHVIFSLLEGLVARRVVECPYSSKHRAGRNPQMSDVWYYLGVGCG